MSSLKLFDKLVLGLYPFVMASSLFFAYFFRYPSSMPAAVILVFEVFYGLLAFSSCRKTKFVRWYCLLILYMLLTIVNYIGGNLPFLAYYTDVRGVIIPMFMVFVGLTNNDEKFYKVFLYSTFVCIAIGLILYFLQPGWYLMYKANLFNSAWYNQEAGASVSEVGVLSDSSTIRFSSFMDSAYCIAYYGTFSLCILINDLFREPNRKIINNRVMSITMLIVIMTGVLFTLMRAAIFFIICVIIYFYFFYRTKSNNKNGKVLLYTLLIMTLVGSVFVAKKTNDRFGSLIIESITVRIDQMNILQTGLDDSRTDQNQSTYKSWNNKVWGDGMGSKGSVMREYGKVGITDGNWLRFLVEYGVVGLSIFIYIMFITLKRAWKYRKQLYAEFFIILYALASMSFADTLSKGHMVIIFWVAVGRVWNNEYIKSILVNKQSIK